ncbi:hypothetical protein CTI12_AA219700 [Artemisia annua]|uniref:Protein kinase domain-containing protein n=1 Tax=Artemisia annua TaxID=35608 RepID=A0A2U1NSF8_ARTAN|nr:hypothetical protein CTI12_AA219700 [Artemisia annua]
MSFSCENLENHVIPLEEIELATQNFSQENWISEVEFGEIYRGELSERWENCTAAFKRFHLDRCQGKKEFLNELKFISSFNHECIVPFIGYYDEGGYMVIVYEYPVNGSLADILRDPYKRGCLTWAQRLKICLGVAAGLNYLHTGLGADGRVIHGSITKSNILLDDNLKSKICGFEISALIPSNQPRQQVYRPNAPDCGYMDPIYLATSFLKAESDVYSFGVLLFDIMVRRLTFDGMTTYGNDDPTYMIKLVRRCSDHGLDKLIDRVLRDQIGGRSFHIIKEMAYKCISYNMKDRPTLDRIIKSIEEALDIHNQEAASTITKRSRGYENILQVLIPLEEIKLATGNFSPESTVVANHLENSYRGQLSAAWKNRTVTIKRYHFDISELNDWLNDQVEILFRFRHENINPCIGYCDEDNQFMLVFEHPINGSLVDHLQDPNKLRCITWEQRLKICIGAARGLKCLHSGLWEENRVVHRRFRSEFILLDENMEARISDIDFSILVSRNQPQAYDCLDPTSNYEDYVDPVYKESEIINVEVDVYSFGVVMFEILSGLMAFNIKERPSMNRIIKRIEEALYIQNHGAATSTSTKLSHHYQKLEDLLIPLTEISLATGDFSKDSRIGDGGFGVVYKGRLSDRWQNHEAAIKRLDKTGHQGKKEFLNELRLISRFHHQNIISFIGTNYYMDPIYHESGILRTESDVYSFGVVMFEMLSGMLAWYRKSFGRDKRQPLINLVRRYYDYGKDLLIDPQIKDQIDNSSFHTFFEIAYQCISFNSKERPRMETIVDKIEEALEYQVLKEVSSKGD